MGADRLSPSAGRLRRLGQALTTFLFPARCAACRSFWPPAMPEVGGGVVSFDGPAHASGILCPDCLNQCRWVQSPLCSRCGLMFKSRVGEDHRCSDCLTQSGHYGRARAVGIYEGGLMDLVHQLKYQGRTALIPSMARMLRDTYRRCWQGRAVDLAIPVPLHPRRLRRRGFNQADLLLRAWLKSGVGGPGPPGPDRETRILLRNRPTPPQTGLDRRARRRNMRGAFMVRDREKIQGKRLLLVDAVFTTGATVEEAARVLRAAGADVVDVLTFVRTLR